MRKFQPAFCVGLLALALCASCADTPPSEITLDRPEIEFKASGGDEKVTLATTAEWALDRSTLPAWLKLDHPSGGGAKEITLTAAENESYDPRSASVLFVCMKGGNNVVLKVAQAAEEKEEFGFSYLWFSPFRSADYTIGADGVERRYDFTSYAMFVNPASGMGDNIFLGNLFNPKMKTATDIDAYRGYTFNPIAATTNAPTVYSRSYTPSKSADREFADAIIATNPKQSESFFADMSGVTYGSRRELHLVGMGNMGIALDEAISGKSYREQDMTKRCGVIYSFCHSWFSIAMDYPERLTVEDRSEFDFPEGTMSYIDQITYGRVGFLIVESNHNKKKVGTVTRAIIDGRFGELSERDKAVLNDMEAYHVWFDKDGKLQMTKGKEDAIVSYKNQSAKSDEVFLMSFTSSDHTTHGMSNVAYEVALP